MSTYLAQYQTTNSGGDNNEVSSAISAMIGVRRAAAIASVMEGYATPNLNAYMLCGTHLRTMAAGGPVDTAHAFGVSEVLIGTPSWDQVGARFGFDNYKVGNNGQSLPEIPSGGNKTIEGVFIYVSDTWVQLQFNGNASVIIPSGGTAWSDPLSTTIPKNSMLRLRTAWADTLGAETIGTYRRTHVTQGGTALAFTQYGTTSLVAKASDGSAIGTTGANGVYVDTYGPSRMVAKGWDGSPVALLIGDSIMHSEDLFDERGNFGFFPRIIDSPVGGRNSYSNYSKAGTSFASTFKNNQFALRKASLDMLPNLPFTHIVMNMGVNDAANVQSLDVPSAIAEWQDLFRLGINTLKEWFAGVPIIMSTMTPRAFTAQSNGLPWSFTTNKSYLTAANEPTNDAETGGIANTPLWKWDNFKDGPGIEAPRQFVNQWLVHRSDPVFAGVTVLDLRSVFYDAEHGDRWRVLPERGTLINAIASGVNSVVLSFAPRIGAILVIEPGHATLSDRFGAGTVRTVTPNGDGNFTVIITSNSQMAHAAGVAVATSVTSDRTHPRPVLHDEAVALLAPWKATGGIRRA
jgi:hypothetical protein